MHECHNAHPLPQIIPLCLRIMETGSELSKTVATFIVQKVLLDDMGLQYVCATAERFFAVTNVLNSMVIGLTKEPSVRLLKHLIRCYLRLSENVRGREALKHCLPGLSPRHRRAPPAQRRLGEFRFSINDTRATATH